MSAAAPASAQGNNRGSWQDRLKEHCRAAKLREPLFHIVSDRRGGRTAWSSTVDVAGLNIAARYWYDGQYLNNAREDAAEVALQQLNAQPPSSTTYAGQF
ncbi:uncharacterized protein TRUGW13939_01960 [Talaromyces rugulosus]|uniref:DRBM domain-containing protein n=1 Tax=Talaromyces rugulosus TaxID=121627 RepID=A0A7H8QLQ2_TALRU|nr:uncharacterized protein TRUGW13939_01960 [Talaromyces rugulosus]QKX54870.1 hypothetical protein TRUGW13939_01960 [Talaromyces rugulosus]